MKTTKYVFLLLVLLLSATLLSGCFNNDLPTAMGNLAVAVNLPGWVSPQFVDYTINLTEITVTVSRLNYTYTQSIDPAESTAATFIDLPTGIWNIAVTAKDVDGIEIFRGTGAATVKEASTASASVKMEMINGDLEMKVVFPDGVEVVSGLVTLSDPIDVENVYTQELSIGTGSGTTVFQNIRPATWPVTVELYGSEDNLVADSEGYVDILPGRMTLAEAQLSAIEGLVITFSYDLPPANPTGLTGERIEDGVQLSWNANSESDISGYLVYRGDATGQKTLLNLYVVTETTYLDVAANPAEENRYWVQAVNAQNRSSSLSEEFVLGAASPDSI